MVPHHHAGNCLLRQIRFSLLKRKTSLTVEGLVVCFLLPICWGECWHVYFRCILWNICWTLHCTVNYTTPAADTSCLWLAPPMATVTNLCVKEGKGKHSSLISKMYQGGVHPARHWLLPFQFNAFVPRIWGVNKKREAWLRPLGPPSLLSSRLSQCWQKALCIHATLTFTVVLSDFI